MATQLVPGALIAPTLRLVRPLGQGGMARVWIADHLAFRTQVVVKFMSEELAHNEDALARFSREAAAASQVKSPHVVHMIEFGVAHNELPYIAMELLEGKDLAQVLARYGALSPDGALKIVTQVARALGRAHEKGIVHRDIKPENIFLIDAGGGEIFAKVLDFGVAKAALADAVRTTGTGLMVGTPLYMSPEQVLGEKTIDHRSDLWSLGVVAFEALTGGVPFVGETVGGISIAICHAPIPKPSQRNATLGPGIDAWFARACARDVGARFGSAKEMADALATAIAADEELAHEQTVVSAPAFATESAPHPPSAPALVATMIEVSEDTVVRSPLASPHVTTNGALSRADALAPLAPSRPPALDRRLVLGLGVGGVFVTAAAVVLTLVLRTRSDASSEETTRRPAHHADTALAASTSAPVASTPSAPTTPTASATAPAVVDSAAPSATTKPPAPVVKSAPLPTAAPITTNVQSPKSTAGGFPSSKPPKPKGKNVVIE